MEAPSELDTNSCDGLTRLFRFAIETRGNEADQAALRRLERRFGLQAYEPKLRGTLEDFVRYLDDFTPDQRFASVCTLISNLLGNQGTVPDKLTDALLKISSDHRIVRFSFTPSLLVCLRHAKEALHIRRRRYAGYEIRYAGVGPNRELMAFASLFLGLPIYTELGPPWDPDMLLDNGDPNAEPPDLEVSFPPADFRLSVAPHLEPSIRASKLPRAVDRGKYDLESVMLEYLCNTDSEALVFISEAFLSSTKQSRLLTRQHLLNRLRITQVSEFQLTQPSTFMLRLDGSGYGNERIQIDVSRTAEHLSSEISFRHEIRRRKIFISIEEIQAAGDTLRPSRYIETGPTGGSELIVQMANDEKSARYKLADLFEIIRPKTTRDDPVGTFIVEEVRAGNISMNGEISGAFRRFNVRSTLAVGLEEQIIKPGDILFAHRGPIGRVAYVAESDTNKHQLWAGQTLLIFRLRKKTAQTPNVHYCDPRALFMYLLTPEVQLDWHHFATDSRSPAIPIGQIEGFSLPNRILASKKIKKGKSERTLAPNQESVGLIISEFENRQNKLVKLREIQKEMSKGLDRVWDLAWADSTSGNEDQD